MTQDQYNVLNAKLDLIVDGIQIIIDALEPEQEPESEDDFIQHRPL
jgi:hypothetical protein